MPDKKEEKQKELEGGQDALLEESDEKRDLGRELEACREERAEYLAGWKRAKADLANYKREERERREAALKYANEELIRSLLTVLDSFDLAIQAMERQGEVEKGVYMIRSQLKDILKRHGLEPIPISPGGAFDPQIHEAVATIPSETYSEDEIVEMVEAGYRLYDKVIRAARVKVASSQSERNNE